ncbi:MAG TPA: histidine phosphatase family protein [Roseiflexaceae bacterium]|nr:histidine phosphatase family protein [Roseiflexaceae bacterium]
MHDFPNRRRLYLMRHGEVNYFEQGRPAPPDGVHLNEEGRAQAQAAAAALADISFDRAVTSGLPRTDETAAIVLGDRKLRVETEPELREIRGGRLADIPAEELRRTFVDALTRRLSAADTFLLGESFGDFRDRVLPAFHTLLADTSWNTLLLVAHGAVNRVILADVIGLDLYGLGHLEQDAGCINLLDFDDQGYGIVRLLNYTPYNPLKHGLALTTMERYFLEFPPMEE